MIGEWCSKTSVTVLKLFECHHHVDGGYLRDSIVVSISACHVEDPGSIPGRGASLFLAAATNHHHLLWRRGGKQGGLPLVTEVRRVHASSEGVTSRGSS